MALVATIGLDIAKTLFQVHGVDAAGQAVVGRRRRFSKGWRRVLSESRLAAARITGRANSSRAGTRSA